MMKTNQKNMRQTTQRNSGWNKMMAAGLVVMAGVGVIAFTRASSPAQVGALTNGAYDTLAESFNNVGTSDNSNTRLGNFDGAGASYSRQDLAARGWTPGASISYAGTTLNWPASAAGQPDNVIAAGQTVTIDGQGAALTFLTSANNGTSNGTGTIIYNDGTSASYSLSSPDWTSGQIGQNIINLARRNRAGTTQLAAATQLFPVSIPLDKSKTVAFVKLPTTTGGKMHVFAMGIRPADNEWTASWGASPERIQTGATWRNQTMRQVVSSTIGGTQIRLRFDNSFNTNPVKLGRVTVALQQNGKTPRAVPVTVTFAGSQSAVMPAGAELVSDPLNFNLPAHSRMLVSTYFPDSVTAYSMHSTALQTGYSTAAGAGDRTADTGTAFPTASTFTYSAFISGLDVKSDAGTVVAVGDSITDGLNSLINTNTSYPSNLAYRLGDSRGVVNAGISGNSLLSDYAAAGGVSGMNRQYRDVIAIPGAKTMILMEGTNDIARLASATSIQNGLKATVAKAKSYGLKVYIGTLIPFGGANGASQSLENNRVAVNNWIRSGASGADGVINFDAAVTAGGTLAKMQTMYDSGDHVHPNTAGYQMMSKLVDVSGL